MVTDQTGGGDMDVVAVAESLVVAAAVRRIVVVSTMDILLL